MTSRLVHLIQSSFVAEGNDLEPKPFEQWSSIRNIVLLGEPGSGKTHLFRASAEAVGGFYATARKFQVYGSKQNSQKPFFIDALDEKRSRADSADAIDALVSKIVDVQPNVLRLSCRAADWLGESDLQLFKPYFEENGGYVVLGLDNLTEGEIDQILMTEGFNNPAQFRSQAKRRGVDKLTYNPQSLKMLCSAVQGNQWPESKLDLFRLATEILVKETNDDRERQALGVNDLEKLTQVAGRLFAHILIADLEGLSLVESVADELNPNFRSIPDLNHASALACFSRRVFETPTDDIITYSHRTIAEFMAANWLSSQIEAGLPVSRLLSVITSFGQPMSELRGLHAWLPVLVPEHAERFIAADPYGVLVYGDAASLEPRQRGFLLSQLEELSMKDPWFRAQDWSSEPMGALSKPDMSGRFRSILSDPTSSPHLKSVVLDALANGQLVPEVETELLDIIHDNSESSANRRDAAKALINATTNGRETIGKLIQSLIDDPEAVDFVSTMIIHLGVEHFDAMSIGRLFLAHLNGVEENHVSNLNLLPHQVPVSKLLSILDSLTESELPPVPDGHDHNRRTVARCFNKMLSRVVKSEVELPPKRIWKWIKTQKRIEGGRGLSHADDDLRRYFDERTDIHLAVFDEAVNEIFLDQSWQAFWFDFKFIGPENINFRTFIDHILDRLDAADNFTEIETQLFGLAFAMIWYLEPLDGQLFEVLYFMADAKPELQEQRKSAISDTVYDHHYENARYRLSQQSDRKAGQERDRRDCREHASKIASGQHLGALRHAAYIYLDKYTDLESEHSGIERLIEWFGEDITSLLLTGYQRFVKRDDLPSPEKVFTTYASGKEYGWWYAILVGMDLSWSISPNVDTHSDKILECAFALNLAYPQHSLSKNTYSPMEYEWEKAFLQERQKLAFATIRQAVQISINTDPNKPAVGLHKLCEMKELTKNRSEAILSILKEFPKPSPFDLQTMLSKLMEDESCHYELSELAGEVLSRKSFLRGRHRALWFAVGYILEPDHFRVSFDKYSRTRPHSAWALRDLAKSISFNKASYPITLSLIQLKDIIVWVAQHFDNADFPEDTLHGDENAWDAAEFVRGLINTISSNPGSEAQALLTELIEDKRLTSFRDQLMHVRNSQRARWAELEFRQPSWKQTIDVLNNSTPVNMVDLLALTIDQLSQVGTELRGLNTDVYKSFWNEDQWGRATKPKPEDSCRDRVIDLIHPALRGYGIRVEKEVRAPNEKRSDIALFGPGNMKLPIEVKRSYHSKLWTALLEQLDRQYTIENDTQGHGIYLVMWFGSGKAFAGPKPPNGISRPNNPVELKVALDSQIPMGDRSRLSVVVLDASPHLSA